MHQELHWLDIPEQVNYKLGVLTHRCLLGKAPVYLSNCCIPVSQVTTRRHLCSAARHQVMNFTVSCISWSYLDIVSALTPGHPLSLVWRCWTLYRVIYEILQSAHWPSNSHWRRIFSLPISTFSALGVSCNALYKCTILTYFLTYLLTYLLPIGRW